MHCSEKWISLLTICRKAGKLVMGFDPAKEEILGGRAKGVFLTSDVSPKTKKEVLYHTGQAGVFVQETEFNMDDIAAAVGRRAGVLAVCDEGFAAKLRELSQ